jgi:hypothetical protein
VRHGLRGDSRPGIPTNMDGPRGRSMKTRAKLRQRLRLAAPISISVDLPAR